MFVQVDYIGLPGLPSAAIGLLVVVGVVLGPPAGEVLVLHPSGVLTLSLFPRLLLTALALTPEEFSGPPILNMQVLLYILYN